MTVSTPGIQHYTGDASGGFIDALNTRWHKPALLGFMAIVLFHWAEHIVQAYQAFVLHWPRPMSMGILGMYYPWLMKTEALHYGFALVMVVGLWVLRKGFTGTSHKWWMVAFWIQFWHHIEHALLQGQVIVGRNLFDSPVPMSLAQLVIPRLELHLIYNTIVFVPMVIAMYRHLIPTESERARMGCTCAGQPRLAVA